MNNLPRFYRLSLFLFLLGYGLQLSADVIDSYTADQGPFTVGPGERITDEEAVVETLSVLGDFRVATPGVDDAAEVGSTATLGIQGDVMTCALSFPNTSSLNNGGCSTGYDRGEGPTFNLSASTRFLIDVLDVEGGMTLGITLVDKDKRLSIGRIEKVTPGQLSIAFSDLIQGTFPNGADLSNIDNIGFVITNQQNQVGSVTVGELSTDGPITQGPSGPPSGGDDIVAQEIPGNYFNPARDGEGCQLTLERDQVTFILTCYFYSDGKQFWLIGVGLLVGGQITFPDMTITTGADYGNDFNADDVSRTTWGSVIMTWGDCNNAELELLPVLAGFEEITLDLTHVVPKACGAGGPQGDAVNWMGAYFGPQRDGEGFQLAVEGDGTTFVMTWYTYLDGEQIWLIGSGTRTGSQLSFTNMIITSGADFGSAFKAEDVVRETFGAILMEFVDCNNVLAVVTPVLPQFHAISLPVTKIVPGVCF